MRSVILTAQMELALARIKAIEDLFQTLGSWSGDTAAALAKEKQSLILSLGYYLLDVKPDIHFSTEASE